MFKNHFTKAELVSVIQTFVAGLGADAIVGASFHQIVGGDWSHAALISLGTAILRSFMKAIWLVFSTEAATEVVAEVPAPPVNPQV